MVLVAFIDPLIMELEASKVKQSFFWDTLYIPAIDVSIVHNAMCKSLDL